MSFVFSWGLFHHSASHLPPFPDAQSLQNAVFFCFLRSALISVFGRATALCTTGEIWRGRMFQHAPGPAFQRVKVSSVPSRATGSMICMKKSKIMPFEPQ